MNSKKLSFVFAISVFLLGCASQSQNLSISELNLRQANNEKESVRFYKNKSVLEIQGASQKQLFLLDPDDMKFDVEKNALLATRFSTFYAVFSFGFGRDWYSVNITPEKDGALVKFGLYGEMLTGLPSPIPESFKSNIPISAANNPNDFKIFHDRLEYLLGITSSWPECNDYKSKQLNKDQKMLMCDQIGLENNHP